MIRFEAVSKEFDGARALDNLTFEIEAGEFFILVGKSGSGKTTTLKMINRLIEPSQGKIYRNNQAIKDLDLRSLRLDTGYVLQQGALFPNLTVEENIELIPEMKKWPKAKRQQAVQDLMTKVGLAPDKYKGRYPSQLSGGEQQRVGILRAIISQPQLLLMDEPFSALDPLSKTQLQDLIKQLHQELGLTIVFVTHDMQEALKLGDRICVMQEGQILQIADPATILAEPANETVAQFFKGGEQYA